MRSPSCLRAHGASPAPPGGVPLGGALAAAALLTGLLPGGGWSDMLALLASVAALAAGHERRDRDMLLAAGFAAGLAPAGWLLAPLCLGTAIARGAARHLPGACVTAALTILALPWAMPAAGLPNAAMVAARLPTGLALVAAVGIGVAAWLAARASVTPRAALFAEARLGVMLMAAFLPLPLGAIGFVLMIAAMPLPHAPRWRAANDNMMLRRTARLAA